MRQWISVGDTTVISRTRSWPARRPLRKLGETISSRVYFTSSAVKGLPSCHLTSSRSLTFHCKPSAEILQQIARALEISSETLLRWYVLHVLMLPFTIVIFMAIHFWRVRKDGGISGPL